MTRKLAQYPTEAQAVATRALVSKAFDHPKFATDINGVQRPDATLLEHRFGVEHNEAGTTFATHVPGDAEHGIPFKYPRVEMTGKEFGQLVAAYNRQEASDPWDPTAGQSAQATAKADEAESTSLAAYNVQLAKDGKDLVAAAKAARTAVVALAAVEPLEIER